MNYIHRLRDRLAAMKFPRNGELYQNVVAARQAMTDLYQQMDVMGRQGTVGRRFRERRNDPPGDKSCIVPLEEQSRRSDGRRG